jgi:hypothetical protein
MRRIQSGAHGGAALGQFTDGGQGSEDAPLGISQLCDEGRQLLAEGHRGGVHQVCAPGFEQVRMALGLFLQAFTQFTNTW